MKKSIRKILIGTAAAAMLLWAAGTQALAVYETADVVVYGSGVQAAAAAMEAAKETGVITETGKASLKVIIVCPGNFTGGNAGNRCHDTDGSARCVIGADSSQTVFQGGTYEKLYDRFGRYFNSKEFSTFISNSVQKSGEVKIYDRTDILSAEVDNANKKITKIEAQPIASSQNIYSWVPVNNYEISAKIFIDASEDGRLARLAGVPHTVGRADFDDKYLTDEEKEKGIGIQQAAELMIKIENVNLGADTTDTQFTESKGLYAARGGEKAYENGNNALAEFNKKYIGENIMLAPFTAVQDSENGEYWWINALQVLNVDFRANNKDIGTDAYPSDMLSSARTVDDALSGTVQFITEHRTEIEDALHCFDGFENARLIMGEFGNCITGSALIPRESIHTVLNADKHGEDNYAVTTAAVLGADEDCKDTRVGIGFGYTNMYPYTAADTLSGGKLNWDIAERVRPDLTGNTSPQNPVYIPYEALITESVGNLLLAGYPSSISSYAWNSLRSLPNLCVFGDAAGAAARMSIRHNFPLSRFKDTAYARVLQMLIKKNGGIIDKDLSTGFIYK